jgi:hypothetical protein
VWQTTDAAKALLEKIRAQEVKKRICSQRAEELEETGKGTLPASFMKLFTTSNMGLNVQQTGAGPRDKKMQRNFRTEMIRLYGSYDKKQERLWCPILREWIIPKRAYNSDFSWMLVCHSDCRRCLLSPSTVVNA